MPSLAAGLWDQRLARRLVRPLAGTGVTPNQVTTAGLVLGLAAAAAFAAGGRGPAIWGSVLFALSSIADHMDGELARMTGLASAFGARYDHAVSLITKVLLFAGIGVGLREGPLGGWAVALGLAAGAGIAAIFVQLDRLASLGAAGRQPAVAGFDTEDLMYLVVPVACLGWLEGFLIAAVAGAPAFALWLALRCRRAAGGRR